MREKESMNENNTDKKETYMTCHDDDMFVCDILCDACAYRFENDPLICKKFPNGKPDEIMDPDFYCPGYSAFDLDEFNSLGE